MATTSCGDGRMSTPRGWALWLTGPPAAGKTTLARAIRRRLNSFGLPVVLLDADEVRATLMPETSGTLPEGAIFYHQLIDLAALITSYGLDTIIAATGNRRAYRQWARAMLSPFAEVWVRCPPERRRT